MSSLKNIIKVTTSLLTAGALLAACGSSENTSTPGQYVVSTVVVSDAPTTDAVDLNGDGIKDNVLGNVLNTLASVGGIDVQDALTNDINKGSTILLARVVADDYNNDDSITAEVLLGENPDPTPCSGDDDDECGNHLSGGATFSIKPGSDQATPLSGSVEQSQMLVGPGETTLQVAFSTTGAPLNLNLKLATLTGFLTKGSIEDGIIGGAVTDSDMQNEVFPAMGVTINEAVALDCSLSAAAGCCESDASTGAQILSFFDADDDCQVSTAEIQGNMFVQGLLSPDIDLDDDGVDDAYSLGLKFSAEGANF